jgi:hypothetical protein
MSEKLSVKETKEVLVAGMEVGVFVCKRLSDGAGVDDFLAVLDKLKNDAEFKAVLEKAWEGKEKIPAEAKDIDLAEAGELAITAVTYVPKFIDAFKKA